MPQDLVNSWADPNLFAENFVMVSKELSENYDKFNESIRKGSMGKPAQFWLIYLDLMEHQHRIHIAVQENNFTERIIVWEYFLSFYFATNKINYARYGPYYVQSMKCIDHPYPSLKQILENNCMSIRAPDRYAIRTAIEQRAEQTLNKGAKTTGDVRRFAANQASVLKWTLNGSEQANKTKQLLGMCGLNASSQHCKPQPPLQILQSEDLVSQIVTVLQNEYINPFDISINKSNLLNLNSGVPIPSEITCSPIERKNFS